MDGGRWGRWWDGLWAVDGRRWVVESGRRTVNDVLWAVDGGCNVSTWTVDGGNRCKEDGSEGCKHWSGERTDEQAE